MRIAPTLGYSVSSLESAISLASFTYLGNLDVSNHLLMAR